MRISASGMRAQTARMRMVAENMANANSVADSPEAEPYRRKIVSFRNVVDRLTDTPRVEVQRISRDASPFGRRYDPGHPGADEQGFVRTTNVQSMMEMMDLRSAQRSYEANLSVIQISRTMVQGVLDILR